MNIVIHARPFVRESSLELCNAQIVKKGFVVLSASEIIGFILQDADLKGYLFIPRED